MSEKSNRKNRFNGGAWSNVGTRTALLVAFALVVAACLVPLSRARAEKPSMGVGAQGGVNLPPLAGAMLFAGPTPTVLHMHGNPTDDSGCTGTGTSWL